MFGLIFVVPQSHCVVLERFGKFNRIQHSGIRFKIPFAEKIRCVDSWGDRANKKGFLIELAEQQIDTPSRQCQTRDNVPVKANASIYWRITDPVKAIYEVDVLPDAISDVALNALRVNIGALELDAVLSDREELNLQIASQLSDTGTKWGVIFTRVEIQELTIDKEASSSMLQQMDAERKRRAIVAEAKGEAEAALTVAEADKQAAILRAEGKAKALQLLAQAEYQYLNAIRKMTRSSDAAKLLLAQKYIDGFDIISRNPADKVFVPNSFSGLFSFSTESPIVKPGQFAKPGNHQKRSENTQDNNSNEQGIKF